MQSIEPFMLWAVIYFFINAKQERKSLPAILLLISVFYSVISWYVGYAARPDLFYNKPEPYQFARLFIFLMLAYYLHGRTNRILYFWLLASLALLTTPWTLGGGMQEILLGFQGERIDFGIQTAQHTSMLFGTVFLGCSIFLLNAIKQKKILFSLLLSVLLLPSLAAVYLSGTRAIAIALFICFGLYSLFFINKVDLRYKALTFTFAIILLSGFFYINAGTFKKIDHEYDQISSTWDGSVDSFSDTSFGARVNSWRTSINWVTQRPLLGWGSRGGFIVAQQSPELQGSRSANFGHMHSSYFEVLVRYGFLGAFIFIVLAAWVARNFIKAYKEGHVPEPMAHFLILFFIYWLFINLFESYMFSWTGAYLFNVIVAVAVSYIWQHQTLQSYQNEPLN